MTFLRTNCYHFIGRQNNHNYLNISPNFYQNCLKAQTNTHLMNSPINRSVGLMSAVFDGVCELFVKAIPNIFKGSRCFLVQCYGVVLWSRCGSIGETMDSFP